MFDGKARVMIDPYLNGFAKTLASYQVKPDQITIFGFLLGIFAAIAIGLNLYLTGLVLILLSRLSDGLDGAVAKITGPSDFGGFLDITLDFAFYGIIPLAFIVASPQENGLSGAVLLFSFYVNGASFLALSILAEKRNLTSDERGPKSFFFTTGLAEATETLAVFVLACLMPQWFYIFAYIFAGICFYTAFSRIIHARHLFRA